MSFMAVAVAGSAVVGAIASNSASKRAVGAADRATDASLQAAEWQYDLGRDTLDFNREYYNNVVKPAADFDLQTRQAMAPRLMDAFDKQEDFADQQRQDYLQNWRPLEQRVRQDALNYDSEDNINRRMGIAAANVNQQFSNAAGQQARTLSRFGINPNSSAFANMNAKLANQQALASAGMQTGAAFETMDRGIALRAGAANFGRNMPNAAATFGQLGNQTAGTTAGVTGGALNNSIAAGNFMNNGFNNASGIMNNAGTGFINAARMNLGMAGLQQQGISDLFSGIGQGVGIWGRNGFKLPGSGGGFGVPGGSQSGRPYNYDGAYDPGVGFAADGGDVQSLAGTSGMTANGRNMGLIRGPGNGVSDNVPAVNVDTGQPLRVSNREYIIPEDVLMAKGTEFFDKMIEKYHTPAEVQRMGLSRRA